MELDLEESQELINMSETEEIEEIEDENKVIMTEELINNAAEFSFQWAKNYLLWSVYHFQFLVQKVLIYIFHFWFNRQIKNRQIVFVL